MQLLVEKEKRLCSRKYELNDFARKLVGGKHLRLPADKTSRSYDGRFVYSDDAEDIKKHPFFRNIRWESMREKRPPFVPRVKSWEDTKYFDDEQTISDIDSASSDVEDSEHIQDAETVVASPNNDDKIPGASSSEGTKIGSKASQHHHEDQHIVPSTAIKLNGGNGDATVMTPLLSDQSPAWLHGLSPQWKEEKLEGGSAHSHPRSPSPSPKKRKEKKRARDKILRDPITGPTAMRMRKAGAFIGYAYRKAKDVEDVIKEVLEHNEVVVTDDEAAAALRHFSPVAMNDYGHEKKVYVEHGGKMVRAGC